MTDDEIYRLAEITYGAQSQINKAMQECAELILALSKWGENRAEKADVVDEIADVKIMMRQMMLIFGVEDEVEKRMEYKVRRLRRRLEA